MSKTFYFKQAPTTPVRVVKDGQRRGGCLQCFFRTNPEGCPERRDEREAGSGNCVDERHHYKEVL